MSRTTHRTPRSSRILGLTLALLLPGLALAHGKDGAHVMGTVKEVKAARLVVQTQDKKLQEIMMDENTRYEKGGAPAAAVDVKAGERVVVHGMKMSNGQLHAQLVKFGKAPAKKAAAPAQPKQPADAHGAHAH